MTCYIAQEPPDGKQALARRAARALLSWYDAARRTLPWRVPPGIRPDPYHVWLSEIMLQQTTVATVIPRFHSFVARWPHLEDLAKARTDEVMAQWAGLGYYARARNLHRCAVAVVEEHGGKFPETACALQTLPGIGPYTAAAIAAIAFGEPGAAIDGNVERVITRFAGIQTPLPEAKAEIRREAALLYGSGKDRPGDFVQAMMELGALICRPRKPLCGSCPLRESCAAFKSGSQEDLPRRKPKAFRPVRRGVLYWIERDDDGSLLVHKRPERGLLGGMPGLPASGLSDAEPCFARLLDRAEPAERIDASLRHGFTHFDLVMDIQKCRLACSETRDVAEGIPGLYWLARQDISAHGWPRVFRKAVNLAFK